MKDARLMLKELARKQAMPRPARWWEWFVISAGGILAFAGVNSLLGVIGKTQVLNLPDPLLGIPLRYVLLLFGLLELVAAWLCLFTRKRTLSLGLVAWLVVNFAVYRIGLWTMGWPHPWIFIGGLTNAFNISPFLADAILFQVALYLLAGSAILLLRPPKEAATTPAAPVYFKVHCPTCGGKTAFDAQWVGHTITCPHCGNPLVLNKAA